LSLCLAVAGLEEPVPVATTTCVEAKQQSKKSNATTLEKHTQETLNDGTLQ